MYSESDIEAAIASGAITPEAAEALRASVATGRAAPSVDEESFRLLTGFNDIFVSIAMILLLVAVGWIGSTIGRAIFPAPPFGPDWHWSTDMSFKLMRSAGMTGLVSGGLVATTSWLLAEYFTLHRRMALPSILLLLVFIGAVSGGVVGASELLVPDDRGLAPWRTGIGALMAAIGAYIHWRRFHVPITIAALTGALVATLVSLVLAIVPAARSAWLAVMLVAGLAVFAFAMWWDISDRTRTTRRSDVAFWLHLLAAPLIAHPIFNLLGVLGETVGAGTAIVVVLLYVAFGIVALAVDRRALLVSSLVYVLYALAGLFRQFGAVSLNLALTALVIGSALLLLSAFWHDARRKVVGRLPADWRGRLPVLDRPAPLAIP